MKAAASLIIIAGLAGVGAAGYYFYSSEEYSRAVDRRVEREIADAELSIIRVELVEHGGDTAAYLRELYRGPANGELNLRYARLVSNWLQAYPRLARIPMLGDSLTGLERLGVEIDERFGPGAFAIMQDEYQRYRREGRAREAARLAAEEERRAQAERINRYIEDYYRAHGKLPPSIPENP